MARMICTKNGMIEVFENGDFTVVVPPAETGGEIAPFLVGPESPESDAIVLTTAFAWDGTFPSEADLDPNANDFAAVIGRFSSIEAAKAALRLEVEAKIAAEVWAADNNERMPEGVHDFVRRLLAANKYLVMGSAAALNGGRGLVGIIDGPLYRAQIVGVTLGQDGRVNVNDLSEQEATTDLMKLAQLLNGEQLNVWQVEYDANHGYRPITADGRDEFVPGILGREVSAEEAYILAAAMNSIAYENGAYRAPHEVLCCIHEPLARFMRNEGFLCTCGK